MRERGTIERLKQKYEPSPQHCPSLKGQPIGLKAVVAAFVVIICGFLFGLTIMMMEFGLKSSGMLDDCFNTEETLDQKNFLIRENRSLKLKIAQLENDAMSNALNEMKLPKKS